MRNSTEILNLVVPRTPPRGTLQSRTEARICGNPCVVDGAGHADMEGVVLGPAIGLSESFAAISRRCRVL